MIIAVSQKNKMKIITQYFLGYYVIDATLHCIELIINVLLFIFSLFYFDQI